MHALPRHDDDKSMKQSFLVNPGEIRLEQHLITSTNSSCVNRLPIDNTEFRTIDPIFVKV